MKNCKYTGWLVLVLLFCAHTSFKKASPRITGNTATIELLFKNTVKGENIVLYDSSYTNPFGEAFSINKFRYYISQISLNNLNPGSSPDESFYLIDEKIPESQKIIFKVPAGNYTSLSFLLGVDSLHNVSGAQSGALDPAKDMFWTWNTGYVMAKLEGQSPASTIVNRKYEYHIGGFSGKYNVLKKINLDFPEKKPVLIKAGSTTQLIIEADINTWWQHPNDIKIAERPAINSPGQFALAISDNYKKMFTIKEIITSP